MCCGFVQRAILATLMMWSIVGCTLMPGNGTSGEALTFTTLSQDDELDYKGVRPRIAVVTNAQEADELIQRVFESNLRLAEPLRTLDYQQSFAVLVIRGWQNSDSKTTIQKVTRDSNRVIVDAEFIDPPEDASIQGTLFAPYHLVAIPKTESWNQAITFELINNGEKIADVAHTVP
jgi:hypothetical protein